MATPTLPPLDWNVVNDTVMGGVSSGRVQSDGQTVRFEGELSLESNGGFVSIRTTPQSLGLEDSEGLEVAVRGNGRTWSVNAYREDVPLRAGSYRVELPTKREGITTLRVPWSAFEPRSFGRDVNGAPALDTAADRIHALGFLLADKNPGPFVLDVLSIRPIGRTSPPTVDLAPVRSILQQAISVGVPAYNQGDLTRCRDLYRAALESIGSSNSITTGERRIVERALEASANRSPEAGAWILRHAIDSLTAAR